MNGKQAHASRLEGGHCHNTLQCGSAGSTTESRGGRGLRGVGSRPDVLLVDHRDASALKGSIFILVGDLEGTGLRGGCEREGLRGARR